MNFSKEIQSFSIHSWRNSFRMPIYFFAFILPSISMHIPTPSQLIHPHTVLFLLTVFLIFLYKMVFPFLFKQIFSYLMQTCWFWFHLTIQSSSSPLLLTPYTSKQNSDMHRKKWKHFLYNLNFDPLFSVNIPNGLLSNGWWKDDVHILFDWMEWGHLTRDDKKFTVFPISMYEFEWLA